MDPILHVAACNGDVGALQELLQEDPLALSKAALAISSSDSPLHIAAMLGHTDFAKSVMSRNPELSRELNQQGYSPIHVASIKGYLQIVTELLNFDKGLCFLKDSEGRTPLHCAAIKGRVDVITHLMSCCPESPMEVTDKGETLLHLFVNNGQKEAMVLLISSLRELNLLHKLIDRVDEDGKTALQLAIARNQKQMAKMLSRETKSSGHENITDHYDEETVSKDIAGPFHGNKSSGFRRGEMSWKDKLESLHNAIIVICSLLATCCFDAIISPPGGVWQTRPSKEVFEAETPKNISAFPKAFVSMNITSTDLLAPNKAMSLVLQPDEFLFFLTADATCFMASLITIYLATLATFCSKKIIQTCVLFSVGVMLQIVMVSAGVLYYSIINMIATNAYDIVYTGLFMILVGIVTLSPLTLLVFVYEKSVSEV
ncbi:hypothetical protein LWI28_003003 [Acer negundo]|uniref:PGG domain-containing protein n=1 Tax=Acer negundo TaxID=4023 RepID=A0AAD5IS89_ACENE|nr:hypothetical protein LWI28_003003 [Acer negundo]